MKIGKKDGFYHIDKIMKEYPDALYYVVYGERSNGKTYSTMEYCAERYFKHGEQFAYIRRWGEDIRRKNMSKLFDDISKDGHVERLSGGAYSGVAYGSGKFVPFGIDKDTMEQQYAIAPMGFAFDLNSVEHFKSVPFPKVTTIVFDEFISRRGYLPGEFVFFMNAVSTIIRSRNNVKIIMLGNTVNKYCPYFKEMGLTHVKDQKEGTIDLYTYSNNGLKVAVEYTESSAKKGGKKSDVYFAFDNPQLQMITTGAWEIAAYPHLTTKFRPKDICHQFFIEFDGALIHGKLVYTDKELFIYFHPKTTLIQDDDADIIYTDTPNPKWNYKVGIANQHDELSRAITALMKENRAFYSDNETGEVVRNYILWSTSYNSTRGGN